MGRAEAVLYVVDACLPLCAEDRAALAGLAPERTLVLLNKADLLAVRPELAAEVAALGFRTWLVSARTGAGLAEACVSLRDLLTAGRAEPDPDEVAPNARQARLLEQARADLLALAGDAAAGLPHDILGVRLEAACRLLSELTGEITPDGVLDGVFSRFCIGK
jgi:tRNA modification GTPase